MNNTRLVVLSGAKVYIDHLLQCYVPFHVLLAMDM